MCLLHGYQCSADMHLVPQLLAEHSSNFKSGIDPDYGIVSALLAAFSFRPFQISSPRRAPYLPCAPRAHVQVTMSCVLTRVMRRLSPFACMD